MEDGKRFPVEYNVKGTSTNECPVSLISPESFELVQIYARSKQIGGESGGVSPFGPNLGKWPARMADAFCVLETERVKAETARQSAETGES